MKTKSAPAYILRLSATLFLITALVAAALAGVNAVTAPIIEKMNIQKTQEAIEAVLPGGGEPLESFADDTGIVQAVYASDTGYAILVTPSGFNGEISMMVGIVDGKVHGISIIRHSETPSLGAEAAATNQNGENFRGQFAGLEGVLSVGTDIDALTGATITSRAVTEGVNAALACAEKLG